MPSKRTKQQLVADAIQGYRTATNADAALDRLAAERLGIGDTDLHCINIVESHGGLTAGRLAAEAGLTTGAVTGVIDRLERAGYARRVPDAHDRRKVNVEVTEAFYARAGEVWGPIADDWQRTLAKRFSAAELEAAVAFLAEVHAITERHATRVRALRPRVRATGAAGPRRAG